MPTYEYLCKNCGQQFEVFQSFSAKPLKKHDVCGGEVQKVFHARGVVFKGSGFYVTDSKASKSSMKAPSTSSTSESGGQSESKSDSKSESKSEAKSSGSSTSKSSSSSDD
jgi:putative FmdB family regulatory protein